MKWFKNLKVAYKILLSCALFIFMMVIIVVFSITAMKTVEAGVKDYRENAVIPVIKMGDLKANLLQAKIMFFDIKNKLQENKQVDLKSLNGKASVIREENGKLLKLITERDMDDSEKVAMEKFTNNYAEMGKTLADYVTAVNANDKTRAEEQLNRWIAQYDEIEVMLKELQGETLKKGGAKIEYGFNKMDSIIVYMLVILIVSFIIGSIITVILGKAISNPVRKGLAFAQKIADGDFTERIDSDQKDELGLLSNALNDAADNLEKTITDIINASNNLAQAVEQISSGNQNLSQRTSEQASALEEVAATIEEANSSINQNYENSLNAKQMSEVSSTVAAQGGELVNDAVNSINEVNSSAKKIGDITTVINEIAFQTNLLALNAAVEAARAGDQGRGFAVVAGEVRNLAQRSGDAVKEIAHLINDTVAKVEDGTEKTYKSGDSLKNIIESVKNVANYIGEIAASSNEQKQGMEQISSAIVQLDSMTQHNAALVEETAAASEEMANQSQELLVLMSNFRIRDHSKTAEKKLIRKSEKFYDEIKTGSQSAKVKSVQSDSKSIAELEEQGFQKF